MFACSSCRRAVLVALGVLEMSAVCLAADPRITMSLDGTWQIADSLTAGEIPTAFDHQGPVPGMANLAKPGFPDVDRFDSREFLVDQVRHKLLPESTLIDVPVGMPRQNRNYFWDQRTFRISAKIGHGRRTIVINSGCPQPELHCPAESIRCQQAVIMLRHRCGT